MNIRRVTRDKNEMFKEGFTMIKGFKMKLYEGQEAEYEKRHNQLWPEMKDMIHEYGERITPSFWTKKR